MPRQIQAAQPTTPSLDEFEELPEHLLQTLDDEGLIAYMRRARAAGKAAAMQPAIGILVFGYWDTLVNRARLRLPQASAEDVAAEAVTSAIASAFDGQSVGEFRSWLHTILSRRIADYHEARKRRPQTTELPSEHLGDDEVWGREPAVEFEGDALFASGCLDRAYEEIESQLHRRVIDLYVYGPLSARDTVAKVGDGMTEANVHQISSRFQKRFGELLAEGDTEADG